MVVVTTNWHGARTLLTQGLVHSRHLLNEHIPSSFEDLTRGEKRYARQVARGELVEGAAKNSMDFQKQKVFQVDLQRNFLTAHHLPGNKLSGRAGGRRGNRWGSERKEMGRSRIQEGGIGRENVLDQQGLERRKGWGGLGEEEVEVASENHSLDSVA